MTSLIQLQLHVVQLLLQFGHLAAKPLQLWLLPWLT